MTNSPRLGKKEQRYNFFLNPYLDCRFTACPVCDRSMRQRKLPLVVHLNEPKRPVIVNKTCRYCPDCDLLIAHQNQMDEIASNVLGGKKVSADDYLVIGTVDRKVWKQGLETPLPAQDIVDHLHVFEDVVSFKVRGGWMRDEDAKRLEREEKQTRAAWKEKIKAQKKTRSTV